MSSENHFTVLLFDDGSNHFLIEGENLFIQAIEDGNYEWMEDER
ncbi:hypothetical protein JOC54_002646 [Alkalihalobacillus xiaoxiensis]|uniref:Uncharacterized protein n=1 Tax=Shouchella xiaoxiensis TaxID=766895 RepID=A0ABS2SWJ2_9BACI|nr:hypothetical protein [Shouchella xiaoxiensis]MBM7839366.1 hypothetical protein [Shouchella xiaoxiensis]